MTTHPRTNACTHLVPHLSEAAQRQLEHHAPLERDKVAHVLQNEEAGAVVVAVAEVGHHQAVLELRVLARVEAVHPAEALAGRPPTHQLYLTLAG